MLNTCEKAITFNTMKNIVLMLLVTVRHIPFYDFELFVVLSFYEVTPLTNLHRNVFFNKLFLDISKFSFALHTVLSAETKGSLCSEICELEGVIGLKVDEHCKM